MYAIGKYTIANPPIATNSIQMFGIGTNHSTAPIAIASAANAKIATRVRGSVRIRFLRIHARRNSQFYRYPLTTIPIGMAKYPTSGNAATYINVATASDVMLVLTGVRTSWDAYSVLL